MFSSERLLTVFSGMGDTVGLWEDNIALQPFSVRFPNLYDYAINKKMSFKTGLASSNLLDIFRLPISRVAYNEYLIFKEDLDSLRSDTDQTDVWICNWNGGLYSSRQYYKHQFLQVIPPPPFCWIWKAKCMPRINFFAWLLLADRLNTRDILRRRHKHLEEGYHCVLCHVQVDETSLHLFFDCSSSITRWYSIGIQWGQEDIIFDLLQHQHDNFTGSYFMDLFMIGAWCIWKERNDLIFNHKVPSLVNWKQLFKNEVKLHLFRLPIAKRGLVMNWLNSL
jgi:hypothetical protein